MANGNKSNPGLFDKARILSLFGYKKGANGAGNNSAAILIFSIAVFLLLLLALHIAASSGKGPVTTYSFDRGTWGFQPVGSPLGKIEITRDAPGLPKGNGALSCTYENQVDNFTGIGTNSAPLDNFREIEVTVLSKEDRTLGVVVDEAETGAVYVYTFQVKAGQWVTEKCPPDLFLLSPASSDTNNRLDVENLNSRLVIADMSGFQGEIGQNSFWVSKIVINRGKAPQPAPSR